MRLQTQKAAVSGQQVILMLLALGLVGGGGSFWYYHRLQRRPMELWGPDAMALFIRAPEARLLRLKPLEQGAPQRGAEILTVGPMRLAVVEHRDASLVRGFGHFRQTLVNDRSYIWDEPMGACQPEWEYAVQFSDGTQTATLLLAFNCRRAILAESGASVALNPIAAGLHSFCAEQFEGTQVTSPKGTAP